VAHVIIGEGDSLDRALRRFKRQVQRAGILSDLRRKKYYEKPSEARKRKRAAARRRARRQQSRNNS
jgi:small subunit ribosomal protein S21